MDKIYIYWFYYLDNELYAYTDIKEYAKMFESIRDMNKFNRIKKEITRKDVNDLAREYQTLYLSLIELSTYNEDKNKWIQYKICVTEREKLSMNAISSYESYEGLQLLCWTDPIIFNKKIRKALKILNYDLVHKSLEEGPLLFRKVTNSIKVDELKAFINEYGFTLGGKI